MRVSKFAAYLFAGALAYQILHWIEHIAQVYQHWWLGLPAKASHGILFFLDLEWNHFVFNTGYLLLLGAAWWLWRKNGLRSRLLDSTVIIQSYHVFEHTVKIVQHVRTACEPCPGILGKYFDGVYLHFMFNTLVLLLPLAAGFLMWRGRGRSNSVLPANSV
ncbi:MAG: hypothetical protein AAB539_00430 [Patescibacteria group bacterium]